MEWNVNVRGVGFIGTVHESTEELARCAALSKYGAEGFRDDYDIADPKYIFEDDEFSVSKR